MSALTRAHVEHGPVEVEVVEEPRGPLRIGVEPPEVERLDGVFVVVTVPVPALEERLVLFPPAEVANRTAERIHWVGSGVALLGHGRRVAGAGGKSS